MHGAGFQRASQRTTGPQQPFLPNDFIQSTRPHAFGERLQRIGFRKQGRWHGNGLLAVRHRGIISSRGSHCTGAMKVLRLRSDLLGIETCRTAGPHTR